VKRPRQPRQTKAPHGELLQPGKFADSCSKFRKWEEDEMKITTVFKDASAFPLDISTIKGVPPHLLMGGISTGDIFPQDISVSKLAETTDKNASITVLRLLKKVLTINYSLSVQGQESKIDTLIAKLIYDLQLERFPLAMELKPDLFLNIAGRSFATFNDFIVEGAQIYTTIFEDKMVSSSTYQHGMLQTICGMIASAQARHSNIDKCSISYPTFGVRIVADCFTFLYCDIPAAYLQSLDDGYNLPRLVVTAYPKEGKDIVDSVERRKLGLRFSCESDRQQILQLLVSMREMMLA
jgi:hypothetical protein